MRAIIQRVKRASVNVESKTISSIEQGIVTLLGVARGDTEENLSKLMNKIIELRIFEDDAGKMNRSLRDIGGQHLIVSQFTLLGDCRKGRRPSFGDAESPERAKTLYQRAIEMSHAEGVRTQGGEFQADMKIELVNDGPVTFILET